MCFKKIRSIYMREAITNNPDVESRIKYKQVLNNQIESFIKTKTIDPKIKMKSTEVDKNQIIPIQPIFHLKRNGIYKARIVVRGDLQSDDTYGDIDTSLLNMESLKLFLILALEKDLTIRTMDINHAFLYADIKKKLYIQHPQDRSKITPLYISIYGLKQSPKNRDDTLRTFLNKNNFYDTVHPPGLFLNEEKNVMIAAYVDDTIIAGKTEEGIDRIITMFETEFTLNVVGKTVDKFLSTNIFGSDL